MSFCTTEPSRHSGARYLNSTAGLFCSPASISLPLLMANEKSPIQHVPAIERGAEDKSGHVHESMIIATLYSIIAQDPI